MSSDAGSIEFEVPGGVQTQLDYANALIQQEQSRLQNLQQALTQGLPAAYQAIGYDQFSQNPIVGKMVGDILAGKTPEFSAYEKPQGTAPTPVAAPTGERPIDYREEFARRGYKNWGPNDDAANSRRIQEQATWDRQNQAYQQYKNQLNAYNASGMDAGKFQQYYQQAQIQSQLLKQALGTPEQLQAEQSTLKKIGEKLQQAPQLLDTLNQQLQTAVGDMPKFLDQLNTQLGQAIQGSPQWQQQYKPAQFVGWS